MKKNLVSIAEYAKLISTKKKKVSRQRVNEMTMEQKIVPTIIGIHKFIDLNKYPPKDFKKRSK